MPKPYISAENSSKIATFSVLGALLVVFMHVGMVFQIEFGSLTWYVQKFGAVHLATVAVPFFFVVSGFFLACHYNESGWWKRGLLRRLMTLGIPYFVWNAVMFVWYRVLMPYFSGLLSENSNDVQIGKGVVQAFGLSPFVSPIDGPLWYVRCLLLFVLISPIIFFVVRKWAGVSLVVVFVGNFLLGHGHTALSEFWITLPWQNFWTFCISTEGLFYFMVGSIIAFRHVELSRPLAVGLGTVGFGLGVGRIVFLASGIDDQGYLIPFTIPLMLIGCWAVVPAVRISGWIARLAFPVYVLHWIVLSVFEFVLMTFFGISRLTLPLLLLDWLVAVGGSVLVVLALRRMSVRLAELVFGGRC